MDIEKYLLETAHLTSLEDLTYRRIKDLYFLKDGNIPLKIDDIAILIRMPRAKITIKKILDNFFIVNDKKISHSEMDVQIARELHKKNVNSARAYRWNKDGKGFDTKYNALAMRYDSVSNALVTRKNNKDDAKKHKKIVLEKPEDTPQELWDDFLHLRKHKKAPLTNTALNMIQLEVKLAGWTLNKALSECIARGWVGFKAEWVKSTGNAVNLMEHDFTKEINSTHSKENDDFIDVQFMSN